MIKDRKKTIKCDVAERKNVMEEKIVQREIEEKAGAVNQLLKLPRHIKQMGLPGNSPEIYIEDYAEGYLRRLAASDYTECRVAVLVGEFMKSEGKRYVFIRGAIEAEEVWKDNSVCFTSEVWAGIYEKIKRYFPRYEAIGWFLGGPEFLTEITDEIRQIHTDWFGGRDRVLYRVDPVEKEATFYLYDKGELKQWPGYSIYYEKNEEMQDYLVAGAPPSVDEGYTEPVLAEITRKVGRKEETEAEEGEEREKSGPEQGKRPEHESRITEFPGGKRPEKANSGHGVGIAAAIALLAIGAFALRENEIKQLWNSGGETTATPVPGPTSNAALGEGERSTVQVNAGVGPTMSPTQNPGEMSSLLEGEFIPITEAPYSLEGGEVSEDTTNPTVTPDDTPEGAVTPVPEAVDTETLPLNLKLYVVQKGDTLAGICRDFYGDLVRMEEIMGINQITDENWIYAGQELYLP